MKEFKNVCLSSIFNELIDIWAFKMEITSTQWLHRYVVSRINYRHTKWHVIRILIMRSRFNQMKEYMWNYFDRCFQPKIRYPIRVKTLVRIDLTMLSNTFNQYLIDRRWNACLLYFPLRFNGIISLVFNWWKSIRIWIINLQIQTDIYHISLFK